MVGTSPLAVHGRPVDFSLRALADAVTPVNPNVPITIADVASGGFAFPGPGFGVTLDGVSNTAVQTTDGRAFFGDALPDSDFIVAPSPTGAETFLQLRSPASPERFAMRLQLGTGQVVRRVPRSQDAPAGAPQYEILSHAQPVAFVGAPAASDAAGEPVQVTMHLEDTHLVLDVPHRNRDVQYPLMVDPNYVVVAGLPDGGPDFSGWLWQDVTTYASATNPEFSPWWTTCGTGCGRFERMPYSNWYADGDWASWYLTAPTNTYLWAVWFRDQDFTASYNNGYNSEFFNGIATPAWQWEAGAQWGYNGSWGPQPFGPYWLGIQSGSTDVICTVAQCNGLAGTDGNTARETIMAHTQGAAYGSVMATSPTSRATVRLGDADAYLGDRHPPTITNPGDQTWESSVRVDTQDLGLGMNSVTLAGGGVSRTATYDPACGDPWRSPCPPSYSPKFTDMPEGSYQVTATATDITGNAAPQQQWNVQVDSTPPKLTASGSLVTAYQSNTPLREGHPYDETITATDNLSGITDIQVLVDGHQQSDVQMQGPCSLTCTATWTFHPEQFGDGTHHIRALAHDKAGNESDAGSYTGTFEVRSAPSESIGPGAVDLESGNFSLQAQDVNIAGYRSALSVTRTYNSRSVGANPASAPWNAGLSGQSGPFGPGWIWALPTNESASEFVQLVPTSVDPATGAFRTHDPDGAVEVTTVDDEIISFKQASDGSLTAPDDYSDLTLVRDDTADQYTLSDADGNSTVFQRAANGTYEPLRVSQAGQTTTTNYFYDNGQLSWITAAVPRASGITCNKPTGAPLTAGCRALHLVYATATTATGTDTNPASWGEYAGRVSRIEFVTDAPASGVAPTNPTTIAKYAYDSSGMLRSETDARTNLTTTYAYNGYQLATITPPGLQPWTLTYQATASDPDSGRLHSVSRVDPSAGTATSTVVYGVPTTGGSAPYAMGASDVAAWGQQQTASDATAIFPPDEVPSGSPPSDYNRATVYYLDDHDREVNVASPGGHVTTTQYDAWDNVTSTLTAADRDEALAGGGACQASAAELATTNTYVNAGVPDHTKNHVDLIDSKGPMHSVKLQNGTTACGRSETKTVYDENKPTSDDYHLPTTVTAGVLVKGQTDMTDVRKTTIAYTDDDPNPPDPNVGWNLRMPTRETTDPDTGGLQLTTTTKYDASNGLVTDTIQPAGGSGTAHDTHTVYWTAGANSGDPACGGQPDWAGLVCRTGPAAQPTSSSLPSVPITHYTAYNALDEPITVKDTSGSASRTTQVGYDAAGRQISTSVTSDQGTAVPNSGYSYDAATGLPVKVSTASGADVTQYDTLGRPTYYTDSHGSISKTTYDLLGRPSTVTDGKATQTFTYDATTGLPTTLVDSNAGTFHATYNPNGDMATQDLPNGLRATTTYDETGAPTKLSYDKVIKCTSECNWLTFSNATNAQGQIAAQDGTLGHQDYTYDNAGRLSQASDTPAGKPCTIRHYTYDRDSNRTAVTTRPPNPDGSCAPTATGTTVSHSYDEADRISDSNYDYDSFGRITSVPAADANGTGTVPLTATYYANDFVHSLSQDGQTDTYSLDPAGRIDTETRTGTNTNTSTYHYADGSDSPSWISESTDGTHWTRNVLGLDGNLVAIKDSAQGVSLQLTDLHGDVVATASLDQNATGPTRLLPHADEFGVPSSPTTDRYSWLGAKRRDTDMPSGIVLMGERVYDPVLGRFLQVDPVPGGSANAYDYANQDPVNSTDLEGTRPHRKKRLEAFNHSYFDGYGDGGGIVHGAGVALRTDRHRGTIGIRLAASVTPRGARTRELRPAENVEHESTSATLPNNSVYVRIGRHFTGTVVTTVTAAFRVRGRRPLEDVATETFEFINGEEVRRTGGTVYPDPPDTPFL